jgi:hypothetical protein
MVGRRTDGLAITYLSSLKSEIRASLLFPIPLLRNGAQWLLTSRDRPVQVTHQVPLNPHRQMGDYGGGQASDLVVPSGCAIWHNPGWVPLSSWSGSGSGLAGAAPLSFIKVDNFNKVSLRRV